MEHHDERAGAVGVIASGYWPSIVIMGDCLVAGEGVTLQRAGDLPRTCFCKEGRGARAKGAVLAGALKIEPNQTPAGRTCRVPSGG